jgi:hypothetical protein
MLSSLLTKKSEIVYSTLIKHVHSTLKYVLCKLVKLLVGVLFYFIF